MSWHELVNTRYFSEAAIDFVRNGGQYTTAPTGSRDYREYWELQEKRCKEGYSVGGTWITGRHYWFLNFNPIKKIPDAQLFQLMKERRDKHGRLDQRTMSKVLELPRFYHIGWEWYRYKHIAWHGGRFDRVHEPRGGKHIVCAKSRNAGMSYMEAGDGVYNYNFMPGSISYYFAGKEQYLTTDGILNKAYDIVNYIDANIPYWSQNRMEHDTPMHMKASYRDAFGRIKGNMSEIIGVIVDDPEKTRGKRGQKIVFEEGGSFKNLLKALAVSRGSIKDGSFEIGQISVFGTGGEEGPGIEGLEALFDQPEVYGFLAFPNDWDEEEASDTCGYFVPATRVDPMFMDENGNVDEPAALQAQLDQRAILEKAKDIREVDRYKAEYPIKPREVFNRLAKNPFPKHMIYKQMAYIQKSSAVQDILRYGDLTPGSPEEGGWHFIIKTRDEAKPVDQYPHTDKDDLTGCITVVEKPWRNQLGEVPRDMYVMVFDPYYTDQAEDQTSLFDATIWKNYNPFSSINEGMPVAWAVGRQDDINDDIERMFRLAMWYNAEINGEIGGGGQSVLDYARRHQLLHLLGKDLEVTDAHEITEKRNQRYLITLPTEKKKMGLTYLVSWSKEQYGMREDKTPIYNIQRCLKLRLLREMDKFDGKKNADSISNAIAARFVLKEKQFRVAQQRAEGEENFYSRELFTDNTSESEFVEMY